MAATQTPHRRKDLPSRHELEELLREEGLEPQWWGNAPGNTYGWHSHPYHKVLYCAEGGIVFHTHDGDFTLEAGDRLDIEPGTDHGATVAPQGVTCVEAARS